MVVAANRSSAVEWSEIAALPQPHADAVIAYGKEASQFGELRLPKGKGPFPVIVLIHGGCWQSAFSLDHVRNLASAMTSLGFATWTIEYRRLGEPGGGWPGTFLDVGAAVDNLRTLAAKYPLDLKTVIAAGHSAGGHLALWAAGRGQVPKSSAIASANPLPISGVLGLAAISDLAVYSAGDGDCNASTSVLLGGSPSQVPERYKAALMPLAPNIAVTLVHGDQDAIVPIAQSESYVNTVHKLHAKQQVQLVRVAGAGPFRYDFAASTSVVRYRRRFKNP